MTMQSGVFSMTYEDWDKIGDLMHKLHAVTGFFDAFHEDIPTKEQLSGYAMFAIETVDALDDILKIERG